MYGYYVVQDFDLIFRIAVRKIARVCSARARARGKKLDRSVNDDFEHQAYLPTRCQGFTCEFIPVLKNNGRGDRVATLPPLYGH